MNPTYDQAIRCPRCGKPGYAKVEASNTRDSQLTVYCEDKTCPYYGNRWYVLIDLNNQVLFHTHTPYEDPADDPAHPR